VYIPTATLSQGSAATTIFNSLLAADAANVDITSIPASYSNLLLEIHNRTTQAVAAATWILRFNGDSGNNYDLQYIQVNNTTVTGAITTGTSSISFFVCTGSSSSANKFGSTVISIPNYASTTNFKNMTIHSYTHNVGATDAFNRVGGGEWNSTSAINQITCTPASGNFAAGSRFSLYGLA